MFISSRFNKLLSAYFFHHFVRDSLANRLFPLLAMMKEAAILRASLWRDPYDKELSAAFSL